MYKEQSLPVLLKGDLSLGFQEFNSKLLKDKIVRTGLNEVFYLCDVVSAGQEVEHPFQHPAGISLARVNSSADNNT